MPTDADPYDAWSEIVALDPRMVRAFCSMYCVLPLSLLVIGISKIHALRRAHAAASVAAAAVNATGDTNAAKQHSSCNDSSTTAATTAATGTAIAWASPPPVPPATTGKQANVTIAVAAARYIPDDSPRQTAAVAPAPSPLPAVSTVITAISVVPTLPAWYYHKSTQVALLSLLCGLVGCAWCLQSIIRGPVASMNTDEFSLGLALVYLLLLGLGRIKVQHQLSKLGVSMISKTGKKDGRSVAERQKFVRRFSIVLHVALVVNTCMFLLICVILLLIHFDPHHMRHPMAIVMGVVIFIMLPAGPGAAFFVTHSILRTLKEHAANVAAQEANKRVMFRPATEKTLVGAGHQQQPQLQQAQQPRATAASRGNSSPTDDLSEASPPEFPLFAPGGAVAGNDVVQIRLGQPEQIGSNLHSPTNLVSPSAAAGGRGESTRLTGSASSGARTHHHSSSMAISYATLTVGGTGSPRRRTEELPRSVRAALNPTATAAGATGRLGARFSHAPPAALSRPAAQAKDDLAVASSTAPHALTGRPLSNVQPGGIAAAGRVGLAPTLSHRPNSEDIEAHQPPAAAVATANANSAALSSKPSSTSVGASSSGGGPSMLEQLNLWQSKLDQLKKSLIPMLLTVALGLSMMVVPQMSSRMTYLFPSSVAATNVGLFVAAKQLPVDFEVQRR